MSYINNKLKNYPKIHKFYEDAYLFYSKYFEFLPLWILVIKNRNKKYNQKIYFYPEAPVFYHTIFQLCAFQKIKIVKNSREADYIFHFKDVTFRKIDKKLVSLSKKSRVINLNSYDISKSTIGKVFKKVFEYDLTIDPRKHIGRYVKKSNLNSFHDGKVIEKTESPEPGYVYQKLINNIYKGERLEIRIPVFKNQIPFVYLKHRPIDNWFASHNNLVEIKDTKEVLSAQEIRNIIKFCRLMGLDHAELDVLRDRGNKKIYIVDANNTPAGPPYNLSWKDYTNALKLMSDAFVTQFA